MPHRTLPCCANMRGCMGAPTKLTTMTATQIATPSVHACSARCAGMTAPKMVDTCAQAATV